ATDLSPASMGSGRMGVGWWNASHLTDGKTVDEMVGALAIRAERYQRGAVRITITVKQAEGAHIRRPTALHGLVMKEYRPVEPDAAWGRTRGGVQEAVADPIPLGSPELEAVPAGATPVPLTASGASPTTPASTVPASPVG